MEENRRVEIPNLKSRLSLHVTEEAVRNEPLLKYVCSLCDDLFPGKELLYNGDSTESIDLLFDPETGGELLDRMFIPIPSDYTIVESEYPLIFAKRYVANAFYDIRPNLYIAATELHASLRNYGIELEPFWYLCLFLRDYVDSLYDDTNTFNKSARQQITSMIKAIKNMKPGATLKLHTGKGGDNVEISSSFVIEEIGEFLSKTLEEYHSSFMLNARTSNDNNANKLTDMEKYAVYYHMMKLFLSGFKAKRRDRNASANKYLLASRCLYVVGLAEGEYYQAATYRGNLLENNMSRYKKVGIYHASDVYPEIF